MRIFVVYGSSQVAARVIYALQRIPSVRFVGQAHDDDVSIPAIRSSQPDVVMFIGLRLDAQELRRILDGLRQRKPIPRILLMADQPFTQYAREWKRIGADHVFEASTEFTTMIDMFRSERIMADPGSGGGQL